MQKILLASHGHLASGLLSTLKIIVGDVSKVHAIDGYTTEQNLTTAINCELNSITKDDQLIIFTDLLGGSVNQLVTKRTMECGVPAIIVGGFNVALVLAVLLSDKPVSRVQMQQYIEEARKEMEMVVISESVDKNSDEEDFFG